MLMDADLLGDLVSVHDPHGVPPDYVPIPKFASSRGTF
jgi:hypothetical protein